MTFKDERKFKRINTSKQFRIFTSLSCCPLTVPLKNISEKGAFIKSKFLPEINETISYASLDEDGMEESFGNARVVWRREKGTEEEVGFGIELID